jgi:hypothetical protein
MDWKKRAQNVSFYSVGLAIIILGAAILAVGSAFWLMNFFFDYSFAIPSLKIMGGAIIMALGYLIVEMELLRQK